MGFGSLNPCNGIAEIMEITWWSGRGRILSDEGYGVKLEQSLVGRDSPFLPTPHAATSLQGTVEKHRNTTVPESFQHCHSLQKIMQRIISSAEPPHHRSYGLCLLSDLVVRASWKNLCAFCREKSKSENIAP